MAFLSNPEFPTTAFGEIANAQSTPITQISAQYGFTDKTEIFAGISGANTIIDGQFKCESGTNIDGFAAITTRRQVTYRPGQGVLARFTARFGTPQVGANQLAGLSNNTDGLNFGYVGEDFGIIHDSNGASEIQELTITTPASGAENATVTVDGTGYTVPLTSGSVEDNAIEISESLNSQVLLYDFEAVGEEVIARSLLAAPGGVFGFTSATCVAAWVQQVAGVVSNQDFILQANWNRNTMSTLDPTKGSVYQVQIQGSGFGGLNFFVEDPDTCQMTLVHMIMGCNTSTILSLSHPILRVGWSCSNMGVNTTSVEVFGGSASGFIEGEVVITEPPRSTEQTHSGTTTETVLLSIRSRLVFSNSRNRVETFGIFLTTATDHNKPVIIRMYTGAVLSPPLAYEYVDKDTSSSEISTTQSTVVGGRLLVSVSLSPGGASTIPLKGLIPLIEPGGNITVTSQLTSGASADVSASVIYQEDI